MAKTKAMCIINRTNKLIRIQHEKKHDKGRKAVRIVHLILTTKWLKKKRWKNKLMMVLSMNVPMSKMMMIYVLKYL